VFESKAVRSPITFAARVEPRTFVLRFRTSRVFVRAGEAGVYGGVTVSARERLPSARSLSVVRRRARWSRPANPEATRIIVEGSGAATDTRFLTVSGEPVSDGLHPALNDEAPELLHGDAGTATAAYVSGE
jgi:hypothetical protein